MDLLLLGAGAIVLIGITLWIVWPARTADSLGTSVHSEEVVEKPMSEAVPAGVAPQSDRFEDQYTSATADLAAGGVASAVEVEAVPAEPQAAQLSQREPYGPLVPSPGAATRLSEPEAWGTLAPRRRLGVGAGAVLAVSGGVGGAWLYARWQRERNKPINRLRRGAREVAGRLGERIPDVDELPYGAAPMSGAATALLLTALVVTRALRRDTDDPAREVRGHTVSLLRESAHQAMERGQDAMKQGRKQSRQLRSRLPTDRVNSIEERRKPAIMRIGLSGIAVVAGGVIAIWRLKLRQRGQPDRSTWYAGE